MQNNTLTKKTYTTGRKKTKIVVAICIVAIAVLVTLSVYIVYDNAFSYTPPHFDNTAITGMPSSTEDTFGYINTKYGFSFGIDAAPKCSNSQLELNYTNPESNNVWLMISIKDKDGEKEYGKSGIIKPGEYIKSVRISKSVSDEVSYEIYAFTPETYISQGSICLSKIFVI